MEKPLFFISSIISSAYSTASGLIIANVLSTVTAGWSGKIGLSSMLVDYGIASATVVQYPRLPFVVARQLKII